MNGRGRSVGGSGAGTSVSVGQMAGQWALSQQQVEVQVQIFNRDGLMSDEKKSCRWRAEQYVKCMNITPRKEEFIHGWQGSIVLVSCFLLWIWLGPSS